MHFNKIKVAHVVLQTALKLNTLFCNWIGKSIIDIKNNKEKQKNNNYICTIPQIPEPAK